jgi:hypothetical protein
LQQRCNGSTHPRPGPYSLSFHIKPLASTVPLQLNLAKYFDITSLAAKYLRSSPASLSFHIKPLASKVPLQQNLAKSLLKPHWLQHTFTLTLLLSLFISNR